MDEKKILIAEDEEKASDVLKRVLVKNNWIVKCATNGKDALRILKDSRFDILVTDLNMPKMNGMELIDHTQTEINPAPKIIMATAYGSPEVERRAMSLGIYAFIKKPLDYKEVSQVLYKCLKESKANSPGATHQDLDTKTKKPPFIGVGIAISTGGPQTLKQIFDKWSIPDESAFFIVQHGPDWCLQSIAERFNKEFEVKTELAKDGLLPKSGEVYIAPGNHHLCIDPVTYKLRLVDSPPEHFLRPAADPLFRSVSKSFAPHFLAVVLTGLGRDGTLGVQSVADKGGTILIQDPETAIAPFMPRSAIASGVKHRLISLAGMRQAIQENISMLAKKL